jgi:hypothetical protein
VIKTKYYGITSNELQKGFMNNFWGAITALLICGGLLYFWQKASTHRLSWGLIIISYIFWPVAVLRGLYWAFKDCYSFYKSK